MIVCGIDGGQSSTKCVLATSEGQLLGTGAGGPLRHLSAEGGEAHFASSIGQAIEEACAEAHLVPHDIGSLVVGATGIFEDTIEATKGTSIVATLVDTQQIYVCSDALIALYGSLGGKPGIMVISGTGTIAYGLDAGGRLARAGGWGWLIGDEGSAFAIGRAGLRAALYAEDGMGADTSLLNLFYDHFGVGTMHHAKRVYFAADFGAPGFAALAPLVARASAAGDEVARAILEESGEALAREALAVVGKLELGDPINVSPLGGAFTHITGLQRAFERAIHQVSRNMQIEVKVTPPQMPATAGAVLLALKKAGCSFDEATLSAMRAWEL